MEKEKGWVNNILERLDRGVDCNSRVNLFPLAKLKHHPFTSLDHCQVSLDLNQFTSIKAPLFRFEKMWCLRKDYNHLVQKTWCNRFDGSHMFKLVSKCKLIKENSQHWNLSQFGNVFRQHRLVDAKLVVIQAKLIEAPLCENLQQQEDHFF